MQGVSVIVLAKEPRPGRVKTRLCPPFTADQAAQLAEAALRDTLDAAVGCGLRVVLALDGRPPGWVADYPVEVIAQRGEGQAARIAAAFDDAGGPAVLIGMDTPQVTAPQLAQAARLLHGADAVFGPAEDGGWWLLGLRVPDRRLFTGVVMSTSQTGARQRRRLLDAGLRVADVATLLDVDTAPDVARVAALAPGSRFAAAAAEAAGVPAV